MQLTEIGDHLTQLREKLCSERPLLVGVEASICILAEKRSHCQYQGGTNNKIYKGHEIYTNWLKLG